MPAMFMMTRSDRPASVALSNSEVSIEPYASRLRFSMGRSMISALKPLSARSILSALVRLRFEYILTSSPWSCVISN